jgi:hypothetical protein
LPILRIEHPVPDFDGWKQRFDDDPMGREQSGVRRHQISRSVDDPNHVWIDLEFDNADEAAALLDRLRALWTRVEAEGVIGRPRAQILEQFETKAYAP